MDVARKVLGESYSEALAEIRSQLDDVRRGLSSAILLLYPDLDFVGLQAEQARQELGAEAVEVNAITADHTQVTITAAPTGISMTKVPVEDSLCVLTVGTDQPLMVSDIGTDPITEGHAARGMWGSWASVPIHVRGAAAGTVCALETHPRAWDSRDEGKLAAAAQRIGEAVDEWTHASRDASA